MRILTVIETAAERDRKLQGWITALQTAEKEAKAEAVRRKTKPHLYMVSYRVTQDTVKGIGTGDQRRSDLVTMLDSLAPKEKHLSTSTWLIELHILEARAVVTLLQPPLAPSDFLSVAQVAYQNRATMGDAQLDN